MDTLDLVALLLVAYGVIGIALYVRGARRRAQTARIMRRILGY